MGQTVKTDADRWLQRYCQKDTANVICGSKEVFKATFAAHSDPQMWYNARMMIRKEIEKMELRDKILDYLHYHPASKRADIDAFVEEQASSATVMRAI